MEEIRMVRNAATRVPSATPSHGAARPSGTDDLRTLVDVDPVDFCYRASKALQGINLKVPEKRVTAFIGPSGCGKSTLLRCFNRMNDLIDHARMEGHIAFEGRDLTAPETAPAALR